MSAKNVGAPVERISLSVPEAAKAVGMSRRYLDYAIDRGDLVARKAGRKVLIGVDDLREWFEALPAREERSA